MRAFRRYDRRGFTLVELMIVVAIIGVLAALAIYGVRRYLASAKTSEAKNTIGAVSRGAVAAFERETAPSEIVAEGQSSNPNQRGLCGSAQTVPAAPPRGLKYQPITQNGDFDTGNATTGWKCLKFSMTQPIMYSYSYQSGADGTYVSAGRPGAPPIGNPGFEAAAQGDLDGDQGGPGTTSLFAVGGTVNTTSNELVLTTQIFIENEFE